MREELDTKLIEELCGIELTREQKEAVLSAVISGFAAGPHDRDTDRVFCSEESFAFLMTSIFSFVIGICAAAMSFDIEAAAAFVLAAAGTVISWKIR